ncbi:MAG: MBL fold metallo-hydrolase [Achromobacter sp.]|uniref:MBL fold metallo-hydrolase n=1 Tax=Achromobacter sp. TaxID=134375 RepID=UPI0029A4A7C2|nr:MBL fold metallo-hydrolase [Achromobacter sp.]MDX3985720.1 MBL fold metallo-hydrolase [Achromobacter sp.]
MRISNLLSSVILAISVATFAACSTTSSNKETVGFSVPTVAESVVQFQLIRNATVKLKYAGTTFLVDPMLAAKGAYAGFEGTARSELRNPLVDLPMPVSDVLKADAVILTHLHADHWDEAAKALVPRDMPIFTQNEADAAAVRKDGFTEVRVLTEVGSEFNGTRLYKTGGQHGSDQMYAVPQLAKILGEAMGVVFQRPGYKTTYLVGDTIWEPAVDQALTRYKPEVVLLNAGYARVDGFAGSIIMGKEDTYHAYQAAPQATIVNIHMESVNHAVLSRNELRDFIDEKGMDKKRVLVPKDGEAYKF